MERININGIWYIKEESLQKEKKNDIEIYAYLGLNCETADYTFEAKRFYKDDNETFYNGVGIKFTDKRKKIDDYWDSMSFFKGVLVNEPNTIAELREVVDKNGEIDFKAFLLILKDKGWL